MADVKVIEDEKGDITLRSRTDLKAFAVAVVHPLEAHAAQAVLRLDARQCAAAIAANRVAGTVVLIILIGADPHVIDTHISQRNIRNEMVAVKTLRIRRQARLCAVINVVLPNIWLIVVMLKTITS